MAANLYTVKTAGGYHHGDLRVAILAAAAQLLDERGVEAFSLRETARRAGVSAAAPKHHFSDVRALLTALAATSFDELADRLEAASTDRGSDRLSSIRAQGVAYVRFALDRPAHFDLMWRLALLDVTNADYKMAAERAFAALDQLVRGDGASALDRDDPRMAPSISCWSMVHGFARLAREGAFGPGSEAAERAAERLLPTVLSHLVV